MHRLFSNLCQCTLLGHLPLPYSLPSWPTLLTTTIKTPTPEKTCCKAQASPTVRVGWRLPGSFPASPSSKGNGERLEGTEHRLNPSSQLTTVWPCVSHLGSVEQLWAGENWTYFVECTLPGTKPQTSYNLYSHEWMRGLEMTRVMKMPCLGLFHFQN